MQTECRELALCRGAARSRHFDGKGTKNTSLISHQSSREQMPETDTKMTLHHELTDEIENNDIQDEYTVKF